MSDGSFRVTLQVYDLSNGLARQMSLPFLGKQIDGIWHTAVVVYGAEYFFGGGIQHAPPNSTPYGRPVEVMELGTTYIPRDLFEEYLIELGAKYNVHTYNLLGNNCNNFSDDVSQFLTGNPIPPHITGLPAEVLNSPMGSMLAPMLTQMENQMRSQGNATMVNPMAAPAPAPASIPAPTPTPPPPAKPVAQPSSPQEGVAKQNMQAAFQQQVQAEFKTILAEGKMSANEAAAEAIGRAKEKLKSV